MLRFSGAGKRDPVVEEWLSLTNALTALARTWFERMRACGDDIRELMHDGCPVACVEDAPFAYVNVFKAHTNVVSSTVRILMTPPGCSKALERTCVT